MTAAAKFRLELLYALPPGDAARLIQALPRDVFSETMSAVAEGQQLAEILPRMGEIERQRAMRVIHPLVLRAANNRMTAKDRERLKGSVSLAIWDGIATVAESEIKAWANDLTLAPPDAARKLWRNLDMESRARVALSMTEYQTGRLQAILK